jgi:dTDP-glucose 4,6-dehydratase
MKNINHSGAGFIGSHVVRRFVNKYQYQIFNLDCAGNLENIVDIENAPNYTFIKGDIVDADFIDTFCGASI